MPNYREISGILKLLSSSCLVASILKTAINQIQSPTVSYLNQVVLTRDVSRFCVTSPPALPLFKGKVSGGSLIVRAY